MMKWLKTMEKVNKNKARMQEIENEIFKLSFEDEKKNAVKNNTVDEYKKYKSLADANLETIKKLSYELQVLRIVNKILVSNSKTEFVQETKPIIYEVLKKYNGKKYGEITSKKIHDEIYEKANIYFYMHHDRFGSTYSIAPDNKTKYYYSHRCEIKVSKYGDLAENNLLNDNVINADALLECDCYPHIDIIDNPTQYAKQILKQFEQAKKASEKAYAEISKFNTLINLHSDGIKKIDLPHHIYNNIDFYI